MPSPVGHEIAGLLIFDLARKHSVIYRKAKTVYLCLLMAVLPDFDFFPGLLEGEPNKYHHGLSHSILIGLVASVLIAGIFCFRDRFWLHITLFFSVILSHLVLDLFSLDQSYPYGLKLLWPFSNEYYISPQTIFTDIRRVNSTSSFMPSLILSKHNWFAVLREVVILGHPVVLMKLYK